MHVFRRQDLPPIKKTPTANPIRNRGKGHFAGIIDLTSFHPNHRTPSLVSVSANRRQDFVNGIDVGGLDQMMVESGLQRTLAVRFFAVSCHGN